VDSLVLVLVAVLLLVLVAEAELAHFVPWLLSFVACSQVADAKLSLLVADVQQLLLLTADVAATKLDCLITDF